MKKLLTTVLVLCTILGYAQINTLAPGSAAPDIKLKNIDNKELSFKDFPDAKGFIIVFTCNTCPVSMAYEQRIIALSKKLTPLGYPVIAINPNDPVISTGDSFVKMQQRAKSRNYPFPYLFDPGQTVTNLYGATKTPHLFLAQKTKGGVIVQYTGAIDDDQEEANPDRNKFVEEAVKALNSNKKPAVTATKAIGCTVKRAI